MSTEYLKIRSVFHFNVVSYENTTFKYILDKYYVHFSFLLVHAKARNETNFI